ncbi:kin of IRRE-like protein 2 [Galendromus occidentalis]|uniref:Kin of IRRE-like protein 2 n=1 Tax=Galendromus occidentalis TaxID=34638 RepID=A0AAJ7SHR5_9ACAR|nr:kin of IRRE-like protein 2 [Galendromus occidentalis]
MRFTSACFVCGLAVLLSDFVRAVQQFETEPVDVEVNPLQAVKLGCRIRNRKGECVWLKNRRVVGKIPGKYHFSREPGDGDCSITISNTKLEEDDGDWQCQVTMASLEDLGLESREASLRVREAPLPPRIEDDNQHGDRISARAGESRKINCISRMGNPPAYIRWFLGNEEITHSSTQTNATDVSKPKTFVASSLLHYTFEKADHGRTLSCRAYHGAYGAASPTSQIPIESGYYNDVRHHPTAVSSYKEVTVTLDVMYKPTVRLEGNPHQDIEEGGNLTVRCVADANPPANIVWRKSGHASIFGIKEEITFTGIKRSNSGVYSCSARNDVGDSPETQIVVDVKYKPKIVRIEPPPPLTFDMREQIRLTCVTEGNPTPKISWLQQNGNGDQKVWNMRGRESTLVVNNATYEYQGVYICEAANEIKGKLYRVQSQEARVDIKGPPMITADPVSNRDRIVVRSDDDALITVAFCADPRPHEVIWTWGSQSLLAGKTLFRYVADPLDKEPGRDDCYKANLTIRSVQKGDARRFSVNITNSHGSVEYSTLLDVREPVSMSLVFAMTTGGVAFLLVSITVFVYLVRSEKLCFTRKYSASGMFKNDPNSDSGSSSSGEHPQPTHNTSRDKLTPKSKKNQPNGKPPAGNAAIPPDALYAGGGNGGRSGQNNTVVTGQASYDVNAIKVPVLPKPDVTLSSSRPPLPSSQPPHQQVQPSPLVYASLDLPQGPNGRLRPDRTEYAQVQFHGQRPPPPNVTTVSVQQF